MGYVSNLTCLCLSLQPSFLQCILTSSQVVYTFFHGVARVKTSRPTILILTFSTGGGHVNLAHSLRDMLSTTYSVDIADPYPANILQQYYTLLSRHFLPLWNLQYTYTDSKTMSLLLHRVLTALIKKRLIAAIEKVKPQLIISTHSLLSYEIARAIEGIEQTVPLVFQLTDLEEVHVSWFTEKHAHAYLAPTREICAQALEEGIARERVYTTGRPIRRQFLQPPGEERDETLSKLSLNPTLPTIFLQGGAQGSAGIEWTIKSILTADVPMQIILAAGNNTQLAASFAGIEHLRVLPFTETIVPYMAASDLIVGKAGASFLSEAFMLEKPFLVTTYIPGQEAPNLRFLERYNVGWVCLDAGAVKPLLEHVMSDTTVIAQKIASIRAYKAWNMQANQNIPLIIEELLTQSGHANR